MNRFRLWFFGNSNEYDLCASRFFFLWYIFFSIVIDKELDNLVDLPLSLYQPVTFHKWLSLPPPSSIWAPWLLLSWKISVVSAALGILSRVSMLTSFFLGYYILGLSWCFGDTHHHHIAPVLVWGILALSVNDRYFSIVNLFSKKLKNERPDEAIFLKLAQLAFCLFFFFAGVSKLRHAGLDFLSSENFQIQIFLTQYNIIAKSHFNLQLQNWLIQNDLVCSFLAAFGLMAELLAPAAFFMRSKWRFVPIAMLAILQVGIYFVFNLKFLVMGSIYLLWIPWHQWKNVFDKFSRGIGSIK